MKETLQVLIQHLVDDPTQVSIQEVEGEKSIIFEVKVAEKDMGKVIGKQGRIASSIRTLMKAIATKENKKITVEFIG